MVRNNDTKKASHRPLLALIAVMTLLLIAGIIALAYGLWQAAQQL